MWKMTAHTFPSYHSFVKMDTFQLTVPLSVHTFVKKVSASPGRGAHFINKCLYKNDTLYKNDIYIQIVFI